MKKLLLALCAIALVLSIAMWKPLNAAYANPVYSMYNATVTEKEKTQGCKLHKIVTQADLVLFDDGTWALTGPVNAVGAWAKTSEKEIWLSPARITDILSTVDSRATAACGVEKHALVPATIIKKMKMSVNSHGRGKFTMNLRGYDEDGKSWVFTYIVKGTVQH